MTRSDRTFSMIFWSAWHGFACLLLTGAAAITLEQPFSISPELLQISVLAFGYLALSLYIVPVARQSSIALVVYLAAAATVGFGGAYLLFRAAGLPASPWIFGVGGIAAAICALIPYLSLKIRVTAILIVATAGLALIATQGFKSDVVASSKRVITTALYSVNVDTYANLVDRPASDGGAIESRGLDAILATGDGKFYWISKTSTGLGAKALAIADPMNRQAYLADFDDPGKAPRLRLTDVTFDQSPVPKNLYVAHQSWNRKQRCYTIRISSIALTWSADGSPRGNGGWRGIFESRPCVSAVPRFDDSETGGRLAWGSQGDLLLTLGALGFSGLEGDQPFSQRRDVDYGKIVKVDPRSGAYSIFSIGHRNPQGLMVAADGRIWSSEHGPQGGDEINLIVEGGNYGWPLATYGTNYGATTWPLNPHGRDHGSYSEPAVAFVPGVAISALIEMQGTEFPGWSGDLLASSLRTEALFRVRLKGDRVIYVESFSLAQRIRDLTRTSDGRVIVWSDAGILIELSREDQDDAYNRNCAGCHDPTFGVAAGPTLDGVVGRPIASVPGFAYSPALKRRNGVWSEAELDAFLRNPNGYAPGTTMVLDGLDEKSRARVIAQLVQKSN